MQMKAQLSALFDEQHICIHSFRLLSLWQRKWVDSKRDFCWFRWIIFVFSAMSNRSKMIKERAQRNHICYYVKAMLSIRDYSARSVNLSRLPINRNSTTIGTLVFPFLLVLVKEKESFIKAPNEFINVIRIYNIIELTIRRNSCQSLQRYSLFLLSFIWYLFSVLCLSQPKRAN